MPTRQSRAIASRLSAAACVFAMLAIAPVAVAQTPAAPPQPTPPAAAAGQTPASKGLPIWVVRDADSTIYMTGTVHLLPDGLDWHSDRFNAAFNDAGFPIATSLTTAAQTRRLLEVYPHPALVTLLTRTYRVPYKVGKTRSYWPALSLDERIDMLLVEFSAIHDALDNVLGPVGIQIPTAAGKLTLSALKRYEDALDALVCAWVGIRYMQGQAIGHGDETAAIWCPSAS